MDQDDLRRLAGGSPFDLATLEKDYALTWLLSGIYHVDLLADRLAFKGGTVIRKVHFPEWRLSEDLDFTVLDDVAPAGIRTGFEEAFAWVEDRSDIAFDFTTFHTNPGVVIARAQYLGPLDHKNTVSLDISLDEELVETPVELDIDGEYDVPSLTVLVYPLNEILVEKLRSVFQRGYARDYYDIWRLLQAHNYDLDEIHDLLVEKCERTDVAYRPGLFFGSDRLAAAERHWGPALGRLTRNLPPFDDVITDLRERIEFPSDEAP